MAAAQVIEDLDTVLLQTNIPMFVTGMNTVPITAQISLPTQEGLLECRVAPLNPIYPTMTKRKIKSYIIQNLTYHIKNYFTMIKIRKILKYGKL